MTIDAIIFMAASWTMVLGLFFWSFRRILTTKAHHDPDGTGPAEPPVPGRAERKA